MRTSWEIAGILARDLISALIALWIVLTVAKLLGV